MSAFGAGHEPSCVSQSIKLHVNVSNAAFVCFAPLIFEVHTCSMHAVMRVCPINVCHLSLSANASVSRRSGHARSRPGGPSSLNALTHSAYGHLQQRVIRRVATGEGWQFLHLLAAGRVSQGSSASRNHLPPPARRAATRPSPLTKRL